MQLRGPLARRSPARADPRDGIHDRPQHSAVMDVRPRQLQGEGDALRIGDDVALRARLAPIGRVRARLRAPLLAAIEALSSEARLKSMPFWRPSRSSSACCRRSHTPAFCQSRKRRQQVIPEPQPISRAATPRACPSATRTGSPSVPRGRRFEVDHPSAWPVQAAAAVRSRPTGHQEGAVSPSPPNAPNPVLLEALRARPIRVGGRVDCRDGDDSRRVLKPDLEAPCGPRPPAAA